MTELLPCPFCGAAPAVEMTGFHLGGRKIFCASDDCMGPHTTASNEDDAAAQWNKRIVGFDRGRIAGDAQGARKAPKINHEAWSKSLIGFIRSKGLERELTDWCGGWKCPIQSSDGGGEVRPANTANMPGSVPGEEVSSSAGGIERTTVRETALTSCAGVTPGPSEALSGTSLARWCYENPNLAARTIEGLRALSEGERGNAAQLYTAELHLNGKYTWCIVRAIPRVETVIEEFGYGPDAYKTAQERLAALKASSLPSTVRS